MATTSLLLHSNAISFSFPPPIDSVSSLRPSIKHSQGPLPISHCLPSFRVGPIKSHPHTSFSSKTHIIYRPKSSNSDTVGLESQTPILNTLENLSFESVAAGMSQMTAANVCKWSAVVCTAVAAARWTVSTPFGPLSRMFGPWFLLAVSLVICDVFCLHKHFMQYLSALYLAKNSKKKKDAEPKAVAVSPGLKEQKWTHEGLIVESLPNGMFRVRLENQDLILGYISGRIRRSFIRILPGDRVKMEINRYDLSKGRIVYRLSNKDSKAED